MFLGRSVTALASRISQYSWDLICVDYEREYKNARVTLNYSTGAIPPFLELCRTILWLIQLSTKDHIERQEIFIEVSAENPWGHRSTRSWWRSALGFLKRYIYDWTLQENSIWAVATCSLIMSSSGMGFLAY